MRAPKNIAKVNYTSGEKYLDSNYNPYTGYYCEVRGKAYPGKVYTGLAKQLILASSLVRDNKVNNYRFVSNPNDFQKEHVLRYFIKYINAVPIVVKEIDFNTYNNFKNNPAYQVISLKYQVLEEGSTFSGLFDDDEVEQADKKMPGIKLYLQDELF
jgi:hypothetical protein